MRRPSVKRLRRIAPRELLRVWSSSVRRSVALPLAGIAAGLIAAGVVVFHPAPRRTTAVPAGYVALVNQQGVLMSDFISQTSTEMPSAARCCTR